MTQENLPVSMQQAPDTWKFIAYGLLVPVVGLGLYGGARFIIATIILAFSTSSSMYQVFCLPMLVFLTPILTFSLPILLVRDATKEQIRNLGIISIVFLIIASMVTIFLPEWAQVLWGF